MVIYLIRKYTLIMFMNNLNAFPMCPAPKLRAGV